MSAHKSYTREKRERGPYCGLLGINQTTGISLSKPMNNK